MDAFYDLTVSHTLYPGDLVAVFDTLNLEHFIRQKNEQGTISIKGI